MPHRTGDATCMHTSPRSLSFQALARLPDEQQLVEQMRNGDRQALDQFFLDYAPRIAAFAARRAALDAPALEDVVQVTLTKAMRALRDFRSDCTLFTWLCGICRNHLCDLRRQAARRPGMKSLDQLEARGSSAIPAGLIDFHDPLEKCCADSTGRAVRHAMNQLPAAHVQVLELRYGDDLPLADIARMLQITESAAESRLVRARQAFRRVWLGEDTASSEAGGEPANASPA